MQKYKQSLRWHVAFFIRYPVFSLTVLVSGAELCSGHYGIVLVGPTSSKLGTTTVEPWRTFFIHLQPLMLDAQKAPT